MVEHLQVTFKHAESQQGSDVKTKVHLALVEKYLLVKAGHRWLDPLPKDLRSLHKRRALKREYQALERELVVQFYFVGSAEAGWTGWSVEPAGAWGASATCWQLNTAF